MPKQKGRPPGRLLHAQCFEALCAARGLLKKDVAADAGISPAFLTDLLLHRGGAGDEVVERLAGSLGVTPAAIFPELAGWIGPIPNRNNRKAA